MFETVFETVLNIMEPYEPSGYLPARNHKKIMITIPINPITINTTPSITKNGKA